MENARPGFLEIQVVAPPVRIRASRVEKRAPAMPLFGHDVGVGSGGFASPAEMFDVNIAPTAVLEDLLAQGVLAHQSGGQQGKWRSRTGQVNEHIVGRAPRAL